MTIVDIETLTAGVPDGARLAIAKDDTGASTCPDDVPVMPLPDPGTLSLVRTRILDEIGETYPKFVSAMR